MGVAANVQLGRMLLNGLAHLRDVSARVSTDVNDENRDGFAIKPQDLGVTMPDLGTINISINGFKRFEIAEPVGNGHIPDIAGMPDLIAIFKERKELFIQEAMRVR